MHDVGVFVAPRFAVLASQVGLQEGVGAWALALVVAVARAAIAREEFAEDGVVLIRHFLEPLASVVERRDPPGADAIEPEREKEATFGVDKPPLAGVFLGPEEPRGLELRPVGPPAVLRSPVRPRVALERLDLLASASGEVVLAVRLARPVAMLVLPEAIDEREELGGDIGAVGVSRETATRRDVVDREGAFFGRFGHEDD